MVKIGMMIGDRYEILEKIGTGGMSDVYKAKCHKLNRFVAVKVLKQEFSENESFVSKFRTEAQAAAGLMHPSIVNVYDVGEENGIYNIAAAEEETRPLREYVEEMYRLCGERGTCLYGKRPPNAEGQINLIPSIEKLQARTGFVPEICFKEGFEALCREEEEKI